jgi:hypothetical protein
MPIRNQVQNIMAGSWRTARVEDEIGDSAVDEGTDEPSYDARERAGY